MARRDGIAYKADGLLALAVIVALWKLASIGIGADIILPAPERVLQTFVHVASTAKFAAAFTATACRGLAAFGISMALGLALGLAGGASRRVEALMAPGLTIVRATPVLAVILLALIWFPAGVVPVFSAVVMAFPVVAADVAAGIRAADPGLIAMADSFGVSRQSALFQIRVPSAMPHVISAARNAVGLSWKVVVAGEVLSMPTHALGTGMQDARMALETAEVFAWAAAGVILCAISDAIFDSLARRIACHTR
ncbi:MAG TPA: ABC transporter permease subunit [bacterium]|nr:ABC transporter permease subunit [bacterium]